MPPGVLVPTPSKVDLACSEDQEVPLYPLLIQVFW